VNRTRLNLAAVVTAALVIGVTGCSAKATGGAASGTVTSGGVKTGPGVTAKTITVGVDTDLSGPIAVLAKPLLQSEQLRLDSVNAAGGVCGRKIELDVQDNGYDQQTAVTRFTEMEPQIAALGELVAPDPTQLNSAVDQAQMLTLPQGASSTGLGNPYVQIVSSTYDTDTITGMDFLAKKVGLGNGDKVGVVYLPGPYGAEVDAAAKFVARNHGYMLVEQQVTPTATNLAAQVTALKAAGVKAIVFGGTPVQIASLVGVATATGLHAPVLVGLPSFAPQLLATPVAAALAKSVYIASPLPPLASSQPEIQQLVAAYQAKYPGSPMTLSSAIEVGTYDADITVQALKAACGAKDLTRAGIMAGLRTLTAFNDGIIGPDDFSNPAKATDDVTYVLQPSVNAVGGLVLVQDKTVSPMVAQYQAAKG
jgi:ABC-type branched-subunit amino acid transport system substrate-binding protein